MDIENMARVHLKQAQLVGYGKQARYVKVLIGELEPLGTEHYAGVSLVPVTVIGYVWDYKGYTLTEPTRMRVATSNILSIEDCKVERTRCDRRRCHQAIAMRGTPETLWARPGPRQVSIQDVDRAQRIIQLREDGTYHIIKDMAAEFADACAVAGSVCSHAHTRRRDEVIFLYDEAHHVFGEQEA